MQTILSYRTKIETLLLVLLPALSFAQHTIAGRLSDQQHNPVPYASVSLLHATDGVIADSLGIFVLPLPAADGQILLVSALGYDELHYPLANVNLPDTLRLVLKSTTGQLNEVVISAGSMDASDERVLSHLKPVDLLSNASSQGDIVGALQNLPGVQRNGGDETGLFVRGGDATETTILIDGITVQNPFFSNVPGVGQRSRFNPFQLKGTAFSTGGYSVRYGQAMSSVLELQTADLPEKTNLSMGANLGGIMLSGAQRLGESALQYSGSYTHLGGYYALSPANYTFDKAPQALNLSSGWVSRTDKGLFKVSMSYNTNSSSTVPDPNYFPAEVRFDLHNQNSLVHASYRHRLNDAWKLTLATAMSHNSDRIRWNDTLLLRDDNRQQLRAELSWSKDERFKLLGGAELQHYRYSREWDTMSGAFEETWVAGFIEAEYKPLRWLVIKPGLRAEYSALLNRMNAAPRIALAIKAGRYGQLGAASGLFWQEASTLYLLQGYRPGFQYALHYLVNYEWLHNNRSFRIEGYYKDYRKLVSESGIPYYPGQYRQHFGAVHNDGYGYARGFDIFWRDHASVKQIDYWVSYSFIDTRRLYQNYPAEAMPDFMSTHNLNLIVRYYPEKLHTVFSAGYNFASGRPYYDPRAEGFLSGRAAAYHNLSVKASYLASFGRLFTAWYINIDNLTNYKNILGYRYSSDGQQKSPVLPPQYRSVFFGVFLSISEFKKDEL